MRAGSRNATHRHRNRVLDGAGLQPVSNHARPVGFSISDFRFSISIGNRQSAIRNSCPSVLAPLRGFLLLLLVSASWGMAQEGHDVDIQAISVSATGRGTNPQFDPKIPRGLRTQLERSNLAYSRYDLVANSRQPAAFGREATFPLPDGEGLGVRPFAPPQPGGLLRLDTRILDRDQRPILNSQLRVRYDATFLLHRPKGDAALILGVSAHQPK